MHEQTNNLQNIANTDFLTGLNNRRYFRERVEHELLRAQRRNTRFSLLMLDIDFFKRVNDNYGHQMGDIVLQKVAQHCQQAVRKVDIVGRFGGEEFVLFLPDSSFANALEIAERLRKGIETSVLAYVDSETIHVTISIGVVNTNQASSSVDKLLDTADKALYEAKRNGRNQICFSALD
ncbi:GGDEF domain-containing protein, partial [Methylocucumis oryzae]|uniref:GGDEF domain-containing protein n=1 Tax=Methylocucumis oryzae TaxID=1632867 RepID=UPI0005F3210A